MRQNYEDFDGGEKLKPDASGKHHIKSTHQSKGRLNFLTALNRGLSELMEEGLNGKNQSRRFASNVEKWKVTG